MSKPRIALDMDGTLARSKERVFKCIGEDVTYEDIVSWDWPMEQFGAGRFLGGFTTAWSQQWQHIEPWEPTIGDTVSELRDRFIVDIVTAQPDNTSIIDGKKAWLETNEIPYADFVTVPFDVSKAELGYDVYIDDKPLLPSAVDELNPEADVFLRDQPYNQNADGIFTRVGSVRLAADIIRGETIIA